MENKNILIILGILVVGYLIFSQTAKPREGVVINAYDREGKLIDTVEMSRGELQSIYYDPDTIVQLPEGTATITFDVVVENDGNIPLTATYISGLLEQV